MRFPCLVMDHDDTVVNSTATLHYPSFVAYCEQYFPDYRCTLEEYIVKNFDPGVIPFFRDEVGMSEEQMLHEQDFWNTFVQSHVPSVYPGMREILRRHKAEGGKLCVVSHSYRDNILRDYRENGLPEPDLVFGWECPREKRKPNPWPLEQIMDTFGFSPSQLLVVDDLKPGYDMAKTAGVPFAAAGWANDIEVIRRFMQANCDWYFASVQSLHDFLYPLDDKEA